MAKSYYPEKWNKAQVENLYKLKRITKEEYDEIIKQDDKENEAK